MKYAISIDLGGTNLKGGIVSKNGTITHYSRSSSEIDRGPKTIMKNLIGAIGTLLNSSRSENKEVEGIGVATPGIIDPVFGGLTGGAENLPGWKNTPFMHIIHKEFGIPVFAHNDVTATVLAEYRYGAGKGMKNIVLASFGTGIGGGIIIEGNLYGGAAGYAGEIGHLVTSFDGEKCGCGVNGCWEAYASLGGIVRTVRTFLANLEHNKDRLKNCSIFTTIRDIDDADIPRILFEAARNGDPCALELIDKIGKYTAVGIGSLINILNPELFIIGGGIAEAGDIYLDAIKKHLPDWTLKDSLESVEIVRAKLGYTAGLIGASILVFEDINRLQI
jgi:glucokinase